jgi:high affinity sulfate transporter 1
VRTPVGAHALRRDLLAGLVLTAISVPAGIGYAEVAGLPPTSGLHASVVAFVVYALVGPSRVLIVGPDSSLAPIIAAALAPLAIVGSDRRLALAGLLAVLVGLVLAVGGLLRLGAVGDFLAKPIRLGFLDGVALVIIASQLPKAFGIATRGDAVIPQLVHLVQDLVDGDGQALAAALSGATIVAWLTLRRWVGVGALPLAMLLTSLVAVLIDAGDEIATVGRLESGAPDLHFGTLEWGDARSLAPAAIGIAVIAFADCVTLSRSIGDRLGDRTDESREMVALGLSNVAAGALGGFAVSASSSRTPAVIEAGATSQRTSVVAAVAIVALMVLAPGATEHVPLAVLSAVVLVAATSLIDVAGARRLWRTSRSDFALVVTSFLGVVVFDVLRGVGIAVALAMLLFVVRSWRPYRAELVRVDDRKGYHDVSRHPEGRRIPGLVIARFDAPLFFANAAGFSKFVLDTVQGAPGPISRVILAAEPITDVDATAADELTSLLDHLAKMGVTMDLAELKGPVKDTLARFGIADRMRYFPTIGTAVDAYVTETGTPWVDWEERRGEG